MNTPKRNFISLVLRRFVHCFIFSIILSSYTSTGSSADPLTYSITYNSNANQHETGEVSGSLPSSTTHSSGALVTVASNSGNLARQGFTFAGWNTASNGSGTTYAAGSGTFTINADTTLYAKWEIPSSARLLANSSETSSVVSITNPNGVTNGNSCIAGIRGITSDGTYIYVRPTGATGYICKLTMAGVVVSVFNIGTGLSSLSENQLSLTYSKGCIFIQPSPNNDSAPDYVGNTSINCVDLSDSSITSISLPAQKPLFPGAFWLHGNLIDFPDGRIGAVSKPYTPAQFLASGADTSTITSCPLAYCKILRLYTLSGTGKSVVPTWSEDMVIAESGNWPDDDHGIATDGTYLYQSRFNEGYRVYALRSGLISYRAFNGSGSGTCGASTGVSGGMCQINYPVTGSNEAGKTLGNNTYWGRNHSTNQYLNGDYNAGKFWVSGSVAPPAGPGSSTQSITYDNNGGSGTISPTTGNTNASVSLSNGSSFSRTGYTLSRWDTATAGNGSSYTLGQTGVTMPAGGFTLYAVWSANSLTVSYDSQGGSSISNGSTTTGGTIAASPGTPTREFHTFNGWFTSNSGGTAIAFPYNHGQTSNFTLYAQWSDSRRIQSLSLAGDTVDKSQSINLSATGYSGTGDISYSISSGDCTLRGNVLTANGGSGTCLVNASIAADSTYQSASALATFTLRTRQSQSITFSQLINTTVNGATQSISATASSGLVVSISTSTPNVCSISSNTVRPISRGTCTVNTSQSGNNSFLPASDVSQSFSVIGLPQTISFSQPVAMTTISDDQKLTATSTSGLTVLFRSMTPNSCQVSGTAIVPVAAGTCTIGALNNGDGTYEVADEVTRSIQIAYVPKSPQRITISPATAMVLGQDPQQISVTSTTSTALQVSAFPSDVCTIDAQRKLIAVADGKCTIRALQNETRQLLVGEAQITVTIFSRATSAQRLVSLNWERPNTIDDQTPLSATQLNARADVPGTYVYTPGLGTKLPGGINDLTVIFTPDDRANFLPVSMTVKILVTRIGAPSVTPTPKTIPSPITTPKVVPSPTPSSSPSDSSMNKIGTILMASNSYFLTNATKETLKALAEQINASGDKQVLINGHTDSQGGVNNTWLSEQRAKAVANYLRPLLRGKELVVRWYASTRPKATGNTKADLATNRRVEIFTKK